MKSFIKNKFPKLFNYAKWAAIKVGDRPVQEIFTRKYNKKEWGSHDSVSGPGSLMESTVNIRAELPGLLKKYNIRTVVDAACGDFNWLSETNIELEKYTGIDVVEEMIAENISKYNNHKRSFVVQDITKDPMPKADLILCRDTFVHLSNKNIFNVLYNFKKSGSELLLTTSFARCGRNEDIFTGGWRLLNLTKAPFNFPPPVDFISEIVTGYANELKGKILGLWLLDDINC